MDRLLCARPWRQFNGRGPWHPVEKLDRGLLNLTVPAMSGPALLPGFWVWTEKRRLRSFSELYKNRLSTCCGQSHCTKHSVIIHSFIRQTCTEQRPRRRRDKMGEAETQALPQKVTACQGGQQPQHMCIQERNKGAFKCSLAGPGGGHDGAEKAYLALGEHSLLRMGSVR